ncbi:TonB-dependent receptor [Mucilaginibacter sp. KACC 22773]|uniref:TonB-dependent receptor plug domain-containing protein n=1 Tax=Mucilaginibacter sp. KACC 22773 TaxID=3025671 RepID=UPI0023656501|nr:TonB-dependent receptor [Mucilaginibacter sp. KACC 22773]WDF81014.1 TonB-dependent receptor [Mucilaginibacter sp. KACC 22773]
MKKKYFKIVFGLLQVGLCSTAVFAQDTTRLLNNVVVTATRSPKKLTDIGRVVTVISAEQINRSQGKTLPQLLNTVPGITFSGAQNAPGISTSVFLRGASSGNTLILIDGFPVNNAGSIDGSYDLNAFPLNQVERIEILKGSGSTLYGSDAVAGVINIITKHPQGQGLKGNVQLTGGSYNTFQESAGLSGLINHTGIAVNLSNTDSRGFAAATDTTNKAGFKKDGFHQRSASVNINQYISEKFSLNGNFQGSYNTGDLPYGAFTNDNNYTYNNTFIFGGLGAKVKLPKGTLVFNASQNTVRNHFKNLPPDNYETNQVTKNTGRISNLEAVLNYNLGSYFDITSGAGYKYSNTSQYSLFEQTGYHPGPSVISDDTAHNSIISVYTSLFFKSNIFHMELGGRYNHHSKYGDNFTYTINPSLYLADQFKVFGTIASAFKSPSLYQLSSQYGNSKLKPETTTSYEAGFDWEVVKNALSFNTVFYKRNTKDVIYFFSESVPPYSSFYKNGSFQKDKGFETELKYNSNKLTASAYFAYVTGKQTDEAGKQTANLYRRPKNTFGANVSYQACANFLIGVNYKYTGNRADQNFATYPSTITTLKSYNLVDLHLQLKATKNLDVFGDLNNVLDQKYTDWLGYNTRGINFTLGAKYRFN